MNKSNSSSGNKNSSSSGRRSDSGQNAALDNNETAATTTFSPDRRSGARSQRPIPAVNLQKQFDDAGVKLNNSNHDNSMRYNENDRSAENYDSNSVDGAGVPPEEGNQVFELANGLSLSFDGQSPQKGRVSVRPGKLKDLCIRHENGFEIKWPGMTNVVGDMIDLANAVLVVDGEIEVYTPETMPPRGQALNKSHRITAPQNVRLLQIADISEKELKEGYAKQVEEAGGRHVFYQYDPHRVEDLWCFESPGFD
mmetsp:Transcript_38006/g.91378  ORF Transcript_38006/g.91378 Transcript_38006/m.91378 type:complete len:253 (+) Transcript_38006:2-760(+)